MTIEKLILEKIESGLDLTPLEQAAKEEIDEIKSNYASLCEKIDAAQDTTHMKPKTIREILKAEPPSSYFKDLADEIKEKNPDINFEDIEKEYSIKTK